MKIIDFEIIEKEDINHKYVHYLKENLGCHPIIFKVKLEENPNNFYYLSPKNDSNPSYERCGNCAFRSDSSKHYERFTYADGTKTCLCCSLEFCNRIQDNLGEKIEARNSTLHKKIRNRLIFLDNEGGGRGRWK